MFVISKGFFSLAVFQIRISSVRFLLVQSNYYKLSATAFSPRRDSDFRRFFFYLREKRPQRAKWHDQGHQQHRPRPVAECLPIVKKLYKPGNDQNDEKRGNKNGGFHSSAAGKIFFLHFHRPTDEQER
jgi:hypothetical protein